MARRTNEARPRIVLGTDFSSTASHAVHRTIEIAIHHEAVVDVVHAVGRVPPAIKRAFGIRTDADPALAELTEHLHAAGVEARAHRVERSPAQALRALASRVDADLVVVGTRGRSLPSHVLGSTAERVAAGVRTPVLLVRNPGKRPYRRVMLAAGRDTGLRRAARAAALAAPGVTVSVLHAYEGQFESALVLHGVDTRNLAGYREEAREEAHKAMLPRVTEIGLPRSALVLRHGDARRVVARTSKASLLVLSRDRATLRRAILGSVTRAVADDGEADLLIV